MRHPLLSVPVLLRYFVYFAFSTMPASKRKHDQVAAAPPHPICLPLAKLSYATVIIDSTGPIPWTHLVSQGDIFAVFETVRTLDSDGATRDSKRFKIVQDPNIMVGLRL